MKNSGRGRERSFYILVGGEQQGPLSEDDLRRLWETGRIESHTYCWEQGTPDWLPVGELTGVLDEVPSTNPSRRAGWQRLKVPATIGAALSLTVLVASAGYVLFIEERIPNPPADPTAKSISQNSESYPQASPKAAEPLKSSQPAAMPPSDKGHELCKRGAQYFHGLDTPKDHAKAKEYFEKAAAMGYPDAMWFLGMMYYDGSDVTPKDLTRAIGFFENGLQQGSSAAINSIGLMYHSGEGLPVDKKRAIELLNMGVKKGDGSSMKILGTIYTTDPEFSNDAAKGVELLEMSVKGGITEAMVELGRLYYTGKVVPSDPERAIQLFKEAADRGNPNATKILGEIARAAKNSADQQNRSSLTCEDWIAKANRAFPDLRAVGIHPRGVPLGKPEAFFNIMGNPGKKVRTDESILMIYFCADGAVILDVDSLILNQAGMISIKAIETR